MPSFSLTGPSPFFTMEYRAGPAQKLRILRIRPRLEAYTSGFRIMRGARSRLDLSHVSAVSGGNSCIRKLLATCPRTC